MFSKFKKAEELATQIKPIRLDFSPSVDYIDTGLSDALANAMKAELNSIYGVKKETESKKTESQEEEEWIWVEGYKGVYADLTARRNFQYEIGKMYHMDADVEVKTCSSGFHLCLSLKDVFRYYSIGGGNRFFKVKALVREKDCVEYGRPAHPFYSSRNDKLAAKSIILERELTLDEIFYENEYADWTEDEKKLALAEGPVAVDLKRNTDRLIEAGYSEKFARYIANDKKRLERALLMESQPGLSMDMKVFAIMYEK